MPRNIARYTGPFAHAGLQRARESALAASARRAAALLAEQGQGGDRHLIHVDDGTRAKLRSAFARDRPGGRNPITGLESFAQDDMPDDGTFDGTVPDQSADTERLPLPALTPDMTAAAIDVLSSVTPAPQNRSSMADHQMTASSDFAASPLDGPSTGSFTTPSPGSTTGVRSPAGGVPVVLPNGEELRLRPDGKGRVQLSPVADLSPVAAAGRELGQIYWPMQSDPQSAPAAFAYLAGSLFRNLRQGGIFDYQRDPVSGSMPHYRAVSNFNVGLFCQQAGLSLDETLGMAGRYAGGFSSNAAPHRPSGLDPDTEDWIRQGYTVGASGVFGRGAARMKGR